MNEFEQPETALGNLEINETHTEVTQKNQSSITVEIL